MSTSTSSPLLLIFGRKYATHTHRVKWHQSDIYHTLWFLKTLFKFFINIPKGGFMTGCLVGYPHIPFIPIQSLASQAFSFKFFSWFDRHSVRVTGDDKFERFQKYRWLLNLAMVSSSTAMSIPSLRNSRKTDFSGWHEHIARNIKTDREMLGSSVIGAFDLGPG